MRLVNRAEWGARPPKQRQLLVLRQQRGTAVHYSASDADEQADHTNCAGRVRGIQNFHMDGRGWSDIAYSYLVCKHGYVFEGRGRGIRTAAQGTDAGNDAYHAVCFLGDDTAGRDDVTDLGRSAIADAVHWCNAWAGVDDVKPHSWFHSTACPGDDLRAWIAAGMPVREEGLSMDDATAIRADLAKLRQDMTVFGTTGLEETFEDLAQRQRDLQKTLAAFQADEAARWQAMGARLDAIEELLTTPPAGPVP